MSSLSNRISQVANNILSIKSELSSSITNMGVNTSSTASFSTINNNINSIPKGEKVVGLSRRSGFITLDYNSASMKTNSAMIKDIDGIYLPPKKELLIFSTYTSGDAYDDKLTPVTINFKTKVDYELRYNYPSNVVSTKKATSCTIDLTKGLVSTILSGRRSYTVTLIITKIYPTTRVAATGVTTQNPGIMTTLS